MRWVVWMAASAAFVVSACSKPEAKPEAAAAPAGPRVVAANDIEAGRYLVLVGGCNDCHTDGFPQSGGAVPEAQRLMGRAVGYQGPWGVSYASNLRLLAANTTEDGWVEIMKTKKLLPPMPSHNLAKMSDPDLRAIYRYVQSLGAAGQPEPENLPPGVAPKTPVENMVPIPPKA
ncbi:cytochrome C [Phenylobacterium sp.]|uniref:cytochrome C n=1 Tax=Phenylobacterium sp. TaxID=1871053 RepID=UPI0025E752A0|nr:cytochrome C [Phenylobacterium sp.]